jgi:predicted nucleic acid-binding protein
MSTHLPRIYVDTSVIGGCCDEEFADASQKLIALAKNRTALLLLSDLMITELQHAPVSVQKVLDQLPFASTEEVRVSDESRALRDAYLAAGVIGPTHRNDAHHVALASLARADMIVSWNFKHLVHFDKIRGFNAVNLRDGYAPIAIYSPLEVV